MSQTEKTLSWILKGGLLLTPFLVFIVVSALYFPFITGKNFAFRILVELLAVVWVYAALRFPRFRPQSSMLAWAVISFVAVLGLATIFALSPYHSFWSNFERMEGYVALMHFLLYFLLLIVAFKDERDWDLFLHTSVGASVIVSLYAIGQAMKLFTIHQGGNRVDASFGNATYLAAYLLFQLFFLVLLFLRKPALWLRITYGVVFLLDGIVLYLTATRGAILGLIGGLFVLAVVLAINARGITRRLSFIGLGIVILVPIVFLLVRNTSFVQRNLVLGRFAAISLNETTTQSRFTIWKMAIEGWRERPILGWGQDSFVYVFSKYYKSSLWRQEPWFDRAHNVFLDWLIAGGILGLASYLAMFVAAFWMLMRAFRKKTIGVPVFGVAVSLLAAHFFQNLFVFDNLTSYLLFFAVLAYVHTMTKNAKEPAANGERRPRARALGVELQIAGTALAAIAFLIVLYIADIKPIMAAKRVLDGVSAAATAQPAGKVDTVIGLFRDGMDLHTFGTTEIREQISQVSGDIVNDGSLADQDKQKFMEFAVGQLEAQNRESPYDIRAKAFLATMYNAAGRAQDSLMKVDELMKLSDQRPQFYFIAAEAYLNMNQADKAIEILKQALSLAPEYDESVANLATVYIITGKENQAEDLLQQFYGKRIVPQMRFAQAYARVGHYDKAIQILEIMVAAAPGNFSAHTSLASLYAQVGRIDDAVGQIQAAMQVEPRFQQQGEAIIQQLRARQTQQKK